MTLNSFLALWVGFMGTLVHQCPLCPLRTLGLVKYAGDHKNATMGTCVHVHVQDIVWAYVSGVSCVHFALSVTLSCPRNGIVGLIPLAPFGAGKLLGGPCHSHQQHWLWFLCPLAKCVCLAHCPRGSTWPLTVLSFIFPRCLRMANAFSCSSVTCASFLGKCLSNSDPLKTDLPSYYPPLVLYGFR